MKTTLDLADDLFARARATAQRDGDSLRTLVEEGLRHVLEEREKRRQPKALHMPTFSGKGAKAGLSAAFSDAGWERIRDAIYPGQP